VYVKKGKTTERVVFGERRRLSFQRGRGGKKQLFWGGGDQKRCLLGGARSCRLMFAKEKGGGGYPEVKSIKKRLEKVSGTTKVEGISRRQ